MNSGFDYDPSLVASYYNNKFAQFGDSVQSVGWGSKADQLMRFDVLMRSLDLAGKSFLDVGCGLGDFVPYITNRFDSNFTYTGIDISSAFVSQATSKYASTNVNFLVTDIFDSSLKPFDIVFLSGALSFKQNGLEEYALRVIKRMYELSNIVTAVNLLSSFVDYQLPKNQHYNPSSIFAYCKTLTPRVNLYHDYPLYEFTVQLFKETS